MSIRLHDLIRNGAAIALLASIAQGHAGTVVDLGNFQADYEAPLLSIYATKDGSKFVSSLRTTENTITLGENSLTVSFKNHPEFISRTDSGFNWGINVRMPLKLQAKTDPVIYKVDFTLEVSTEGTGLLVNSLKTFSQGGAVAERDLSMFYAAPTPTSMHTLTAYLPADQAFDDLAASFRNTYLEQPWGASDMTFRLDNMVISAVAVPEPASTAMLMLGLAAMGGLAAKRRRPHRAD